MYFCLIPSVFGGWHRKYDFFSDFLYKTIMGDQCGAGILGGGEGLEGANRKKNWRKNLKNRKNLEKI